MDEPLKQLHEYTKWHIGIYLTLASAFGAAATADQKNWPVTFHDGWLYAAAVSVAFAGLAGGIVATTCFERATVIDFMDRPTGPDVLAYLARHCVWKNETPPGWARCLVKGRRWTHYEHSSFWIGLACAVIALFNGRSPTWYVSSLAFQETGEVVLCSRDQQPEVVKFWHPKIGRKQTSRTLVWWKVRMTDASLTPSPPRPAGIYAAPDALDKQPLRAADVTPSQCEQACKDPANEALPRCAVGLTNVTLNIEGDSRREKK